MEGEWVLWFVGAAFTASGLVFTLAAPAITRCYARIEDWHCTVFPFLRRWPRLEPSANPVILRIIGIGHLLAGLGCLVAAFVISVLW